MNNNQICSQCRGEVSREDFRCPECGRRVRYKTVKEAYSWRGLGLFDLMPGIRDLPYIARFAVMLITVIALVLLGIRISRF